MSEEIKIKKISTGQQSYEIDAKYWGGRESTTPPNDEIWYTSTDGNSVTFSPGSSSGANVVSNTYENGKGIIKFDGEINVIAASSFEFRDSLSSITIPDSVTSIGYEAFYGCTSLSSISIPNSVTDIEFAAFSGCTSLTSVTIPDSVTSIGEQAFYGCSSLTSVTIPDGVTRIRSEAFYGCSSLTSVTIPDSVTEIVNRSFYNCTSLISVYCKRITPYSISGGAVFGNNASERKIYVPVESVDTYKTASAWSGYIDSIVGCVFEDEPILVLSDEDISSIVNTYFILSASGSGSGGFGDGISLALDDESSDIYEETPIE